MVVWQSRLLASVQNTQLDNSDHNPTDSQERLTCTVRSVVAALVV
jgi:hypothetical protein